MTTATAKRSFLDAAKEEFPPEAEGRSFLDAARDVERGTALLREHGIGEAAPEARPEPTMASPGLDQPIIPGGPTWRGVVAKGYPSTLERGPTYTERAREIVQRRSKRQREAAGKAGWAERGEEPQPTPEELKAGRGVATATELTPAEAKHLREMGKGRITRPSVSKLAEMAEDMGRWQGVKAEAPAPDVEKWGEMGPIGAAEANRRQEFTQVFGVATQARMADLYAATERLKEAKGKGYDIRESDLRTVEDYLLRHYELQARGTTLPADVVKGLKIMPAWMIEFLATGGLAAVGRAAAGKVAAKALGKYAATKAGVIFVKGAGWFGAGAMRTVAMPHRVGAEYFDQLLGENELSDEGKVIVLQAGAKPATAFFNAIANTLIETMSEEAGEALVRGGARALRTLPGGTKLVQLARRLKTAAPKAAWARYLQSGMTKAGYSSLIGEMGEEQLARMMRAVTGTGKEHRGMGLFKRFAESIPSGREILVEGLTLAVPGAVKAGAARVAGAMEGRPPAPTEPMRIEPPRIDLAPVAAEARISVAPTAQPGPVLREGTFLEAAKAEPAKPEPAPTPAAPEVKAALVKAGPKQSWQMTRKEYGAFRAAEISREEQVETVRRHLTAQATRAEVADTMRAVESRWQAELAYQHETAVSRAVREAKPVPAEVLAEYPELAPKPTPAPKKVAKAAPAKPAKKPAAKEPPKLVTDSVRHVQTYGEKDATWLWHQASAAKRAAVDEWLVATEHPSAAQPGTQESRFRALVRELWEKEAAKPKPAKDKFMAPGVVDLAPLADAGEFVAKEAGKIHKATTRFTGLTPEMRESLIAWEEESRRIPRKAALWVKKNLLGKYSLMQQREVMLHLDAPQQHPLADDLKPLADKIRATQDEGYALMEKLGKEPGRWPDAQMAHLGDKLKAEREAEYVTAQARQNQKVRIADLEADLEELQGLGYVHRITKRPGGPKVFILLAKRVKRRLTKKPEGLVGRKFPTIESAEEAGYKVQPLAVSLADYIVRVAQLRHNVALIDAINSNKQLSASVKAAPADWVRIDTDLYPAGRNRKYSPPIAEALEELLAAPPRSKHALVRAYDKINTALKMIGFYNPLVMTKNDLFQLWRASGVKGFAKIPGAALDWLAAKGIDYSQMHPETRLAKALEKFSATRAQRVKRYHMLRKAGLFNNVISYQPAATALVEDMLRVITQSKGERVARFIGRHWNPAEFVKDVRRLNDATTWNIDEVLRIAAFRSLTEGWRAKAPGRWIKAPGPHWYQKFRAGGLTPFEATELANDFLANYGKVPKDTRRVLNRAVFTPTYRMSMARVLGRMWQQPQKFWPQLARHYGYKLFVWYVLPGLIAMHVYGRPWEEGRGEKGYRIIVRLADGTEVAMSLSDPLLEEAKISQRPVLQTMYYNLAAIPHALVSLYDGPKFKRKRDQFGHIFKLGTPFWRDVTRWMDEDQTTAEKVLTQLAIAYVYKRRAKPKDDITAAEALARALSIWTDWKEQKRDIERRLGVQAEQQGRRRRTRRSRR